jgi:hypothetical protein
MSFEGKIAIVTGAAQGIGEGYPSWITGVILNLDGGQLMRL